MEFVWSDGGRAASGFVGLAGDCVTRAIAIASGVSYRNVYQTLGEASQKTARDGVTTTVADDYLQAQGWKRQQGLNEPFMKESLPLGVVIVHLEKGDTRTSGHFCCLIDHVVHDTWNPSDDDDYLVVDYWTSETISAQDRQPDVGPNPKADAAQTLTQIEFEKIMNRLRALDSTASNHASTEGEKRNALRMMQNLMLRHNLSREDITEDDNVESISYTRIACPVNGRRACQWEKSLAAYLTAEIFPLTQWYYGSRGHRTLFWFYGPADDVRNCLALFRELLLTIASAAHLQYRGHTRGSGASYCEGYVRGMPRHQPQEEQMEETVSEAALIHARSLAVHQAARDWLRLECGIGLVTHRGAGRDRHDPNAADRGKQHGAKHDLGSINGRKRIGLS